MYLSKLRLWNFRKFGGSDFDIDTPHLEVPFNQGVNVLIGGNGSGKTAIIDAIKLVLKTHSVEWIRIENLDFHHDQNRLRIECIFKDLDPEEAKNFTEWLGWTGEGEDAKPYLKVFVDVRRNGNQIMPFDVRAGVDEYGNRLYAEAKEYLKATYLRPLRNADAELIPKKNSRLSQILLGHEAFKGREHDHPLLVLFSKLNSQIEAYFDGEPLPDIETDELGKEIKDTINTYLGNFSGKSSNMKVAENKLKNILERLELSIDDDIRPGLGLKNLLFISSELLHLNKEDWNGLRLGLVEEIEAHLHPQNQLRVMEALQDEKIIQLIFTTHSPNIGSKVKLENLLICHDNDVFPLGPSMPGTEHGYTELETNDYYFLERFLDVTKANLFFSRGVIFVEGWSEELILPTLANLIGVSLNATGVSIINVGNTALFRYSRIFQRKDGKNMSIPVAVVTDIDVLPWEENEEVEEGVTKNDEAQNKKKSKYHSQSVKPFVSPHWTLEYCLAQVPEFQEPLFEAIKAASNEMREDGQTVPEITETWEDFSRDVEADDIPLKLYAGLMLRYEHENGSWVKKNRIRIRKPIVAQHFAKNILKKRISEEIILAHSSIAYLVNAINYASGNQQ